MTRRKMKRAIRWHTCVIALIFGRRNSIGEKHVDTRVSTFLGSINVQRQKVKELNSWALASPDWHTCIIRKIFRSPEEVTSSMTHVYHLIRNFRDLSVAQNTFFGCELSSFSNMTHVCHFRGQIRQDDHFLEKDQPNPGFWHARIILFSLPKQIPSCSVSGSRRE